MLLFQWESHVCNLKLYGMQGLQGYADINSLIHEWQKPEENHAHHKICHIYTRVTQAVLPYLRHVFQWFS